MSFYFEEVILVEGESNGENIIDEDEQDISYNDVIQRSIWPGGCTEHGSHHGTPSQS